MEAWVVDRPGPADSGPLTRLERPDPVPGPGQVLVRVIGCGVCRTDLHLAEGDLPPRRHRVVPGHEVVGRVEALGPGAVRFRVGDRVGVPWLARTDGTCRFCRTGAENLCMAGGVALNCVLNGRLRDQRIFRDVWVQPAAGDAGTALGAALWIDWMENGRRREYRMDHAFLGPEYSPAEIERFLLRSKLPFRPLDDVADEVSRLLAEDKVVGWFQGRMEFGPRALGGRSILASPLSASMQQRLNEIKDREDFRPVAPVVLEEEAPLWFLNGARSPFMLFVFDVLPHKADRIPAVKHVDGTARVQTVSRDQHPLYYDLIKSFQRRTGVPVLVNTSFNTRGEPVVCTPRDAIECFWTSPLDALVIGSFLLEKRAP